MFFFFFLSSQTSGGLSHLKHIYSWLDRFDLFVKYQAKVHGDDPTKLKTKDFKRFLCSGIKRSPTNADSRDCKLGSWHQCYRLDGKLIAVAVMDLVPSGVSSVYVL